MISVVAIATATMHRIMTKRLEPDPPTIPTWMGSLNFTVTHRDRRNRYRTETEGEANTSGEAQGSSDSGAAGLSMEASDLTGRLDANQLSSV